MERVRWQLSLHDRPPEVDGIPVDWTSGQADDWLALMQRFRKVRRDYLVHLEQTVYSLTLTHRGLVRPELDSAA